MHKEFIVTFKEAVQFGLTRYFTGKACKHGHIAERLTANRTCSECNQLTFKDWQSKNMGYCLQKMKDWRIANPDKARAREKQKYQRHSAKIIERAKKFAQDNPERVRAVYAAWLNENRPAFRATQAKRRARKLCASPPWLTPEDMAAIKRVYAKADKLTKLTGVAHHVDHIVPLQGRTVCGLHVPWNLQALPARDNLKKSNNFQE